MGTITRQQVDRATELFRCIDARKKIIKSLTGHDFHHVCFVHRGETPSYQTAERDETTAARNAVLKYHQDWLDKYEVELKSMGVVP